MGVACMLFFWVFFVFLGDEQLFVSESVRACMCACAIDQIMVCCSNLDFMLLTHFVCMYVCMCVYVCVCVCVCVCVWSE
jgi:hypothetical protein